MGANTRMQWTIIIVVLVAVAVSSAGCTSNQTTQSPSGSPAGFLTYTNKDAGVEINYPSDWQLTGGSAVGTVAKFEHGNESILFLIQRIVLNKTGLTPRSLAQEFIGANVKGNVSLLENHSTSLGRLPAYATVVKFKLGNETYKALTVFVIKGNYFYEIQYNGIEAQYDEQNATAQQMMASLIFT
jgi:hypothetical protein